MLDKTPVISRLLELVRSAAPALADFSGDVTNVKLREAGLTSMSAVRLMLEIEAAFNVEIPDNELTPENFATLSSIERLVERLRAGAQA